MLFDSLLYFEHGNTVSETIAKHKEHIPDMEVLRKALKKWYHYKKVADRSAKVINYYRKQNIGIPEGVLKTIKTFSENC